MASAVHVLAFNKGDHVCLFYRDLADWTSTAAPYILLGLKRQERCFCVVPEEHAQALRAALAAAGIDPAAEEARGALFIQPPVTVYLRDGVFDGRRMTALLEAAVREAITHEFQGFRALGDLGWAARDSSCCAQLPAYEAMMAEFYPDSPALGLCSYDMRLFDPGELQELMTLHQVALSAPEPAKRSIRLRHGRSYGDIVFDRTLPSVFHYAVLTDDSPALVASGQEPSLSSAMATVKATLSRSRLPGGARGRIA